MHTHTHTQTHTHMYIYINTHMHGLRTFTNHFPSGFRSKIPPSAVSSQSWAPRIHQELLLPFGHPLLWATKKHAEMDTETPFSGKNKWDGSVWHTTYSILFSLASCVQWGGYPFVDQLKSSPQDSAHGQSLIYCQKNITTNSMFTWLVNVAHLLRNYPSIK